MLRHERSQLALAGCETDLIAFMKPGGFRAFTTHHQSSSIREDVKGLERVLPTTVLSITQKPLTLKICLF